ncbi:hypothetical protein EVAR_88274_1 [Eumeta japonica]|uniref:Uncharacterized protein n=1 Tax=Eumeta variegata TaxID=151549 RepID=A0A4C1XKK7_EUMVA|nr:hypothetical protein EVAR_88274_1 [Eumeta japonica]
MRFRPDGARCRAVASRHLSPDPPAEALQIRDRPGAGVLSMRILFIHDDHFAAASGGGRGGATDATEPTPSVCRRRHKN